ncbi:hypothetical protein VT84_06900 [Gemmata sp. SH-PL17]|uniref:hypothetical protein n=1 Tax=Gemmata sp. SH-PL17 TaxID=1630693 RepID=UPI00078E642E|nr:hypothetical protein VT84_06900 [Gemmata sp. SH-PL17]
MRQIEGRADPEAEVVRGHGSAVRGAVTDGRPPLEAPGLNLHARLSAIALSRNRAKGTGARRRS